MSTPDVKLQAVLRSACPPSEEQRSRLTAFLEKKYQQSVELSWSEDKSILGGFRIELGTEVIDWTTGGRLDQLKEKLASISAGGQDVIPLIRDTVKSWVPEVLAYEVGTVLRVADGIAYVSGLEHASYGEILLFEGGIRGMVQDLKEDRIGCILFGDYEAVRAGDAVRRTGKTAGIGAGDAYLGRVVDALGAPIDGKGPITADAYRPIENPAPGIIDRQPVDKPMETGILSIDSMFPIGRGQRELIIGDRQTGKTAIAVDTILNQKGKNVVCIYVAIGQKSSSVAQLTEMLRAAGALEYTTVVCASASDFASMQYIAPYAGCALGEYFMEKGRDVLIVYDDLSKHAIAYRALSLLLERSPGREAYPGDVFYLHSRLLERSAHLSDERGGGSMTALPIVETLDGDVSAYIPTNIISITDGQIYLESNLFFAGQRPAVNVGLSVSRVGGAAQTKAMKKAVGTLRLDLAQYREMEVFTQFSSDLDDDTKQQLVYGQSLMRILRQGRGHPYSEAEQVVLLVTALGHIQQQLPVDRIGAFNAKLLSDFAASRAALMQDIGSTGVLTDENRKAILEQAKRSLADFLSAEAGSGR
ncbi:MAG: F0F1 ATP synthase subunit alpha [Candidatus Limivicinus sp.]|nr:F0F1 ATP synthase subunit alpha [Candidatus Limivicinus sp.]